MKFKQRVATVLRKAAGLLSPVYGYAANVWTTILETTTGSWQQNVTVNETAVAAYHAVFSCITLIASDVAKLRPKLMQLGADGIWTETENAAFSPVLRKPNPYQNRIQFQEWWLISKLYRGNTYALKGRDDRGVVRQLFLMDPTLTRVLVAPDGSVFYEFNSDNLTGLTKTVTVPASEVIHDRFNCLFHPLVGLSPIYACGLAATQGLAMQNNSARLFTNMSRPAGILTAPGTISDTVAARLKSDWQANYSGENYGKVAVLGDDLKWLPVTINPVEAQLIEQLKWTAEVVCSAFHVPPFKVGVGNAPTYQNGEMLNAIYYSDCLQSLIEAFELCMDEGLGLTTPKEGGRLYGVELDLDGLLRMDSKTLTETLVAGITGGLMKPDEARRRMNLPPVAGGGAVYLQQQNYSLEALAKRDAKADPFATTSSAPAPSAAPDEPDEDDADDDVSEEDAKSFAALLRLELRTAA